MLQVGERGIAGAEIVERQPGAELAQLASTFAEYSGFCMTSDSVISSFSVSGATPVRAITAFTSLMRS